MLNNILSNNFGVFLEKSNNNFIYGNNFISNNNHARFYKCFKNHWGKNYWDNWLSMKLKIPIPKIIFGRTGIFGKIPWINTDLFPEFEPWNIDNILITHKNINKKIIQNDYNKIL
jgi:hypothetical protein